MPMCTASNDSLIPEILVDLYNHMDDEEKAFWSRSSAETLIDDMVKYDRERGYEPLPYEVEDVYTFIREVIIQDKEDSE